MEKKKIEADETKIRVLIGELTPLVNFLSTIFQTHLMLRYTHRRTPRDLVINKFNIRLPKKYLTHNLFLQAARASIYDQLWIFLAAADKGLKLDERYKARIASDIIAEQQIAENLPADLKDCFSNAYMDLILESRVKNPADHVAKILHAFAYNRFYADTGTAIEIAADLMPFYNEFVSIMQSDSSIPVKGLKLIKLINSLLQQIESNLDTQRPFLKRQNQNRGQGKSETSEKATQKRTGPQIVSVTNERGDLIYPAEENMSPQQREALQQLADIIVDPAINDNKMEELENKLRELLPSRPKLSKKDTLVSRGPMMGLGSQEFSKEEYEEKVSRLIPIIKRMGALDLLETTSSTTTWTPGDPPDELDIIKTFTSWPIIPGVNTVRAFRETGSMVVLVDLSASMADREENTIQIIASLIIDTKPETITIIGFGQVSKYVCRPTTNIMEALSKLMGIYSHGGTSITPALNLLKDHAGATALVIVTDSEIRDLERFRNSELLRPVISSFKDVYYYSYLNTPNSAYYYREMQKILSEIRRDVKWREIT